MFKSLITNTKQAYAASVMAIMTILASAHAAVAITLPTDTTSFAYDAYKIFVVDGIKGPAGAAIVIGIVGLSAYEFKQSPMGGGAGFVTAGLIAKADAVAKTLGVTF